MPFLALTLAVALAAEPADAPAPAAADEVRKLMERELPKLEAHPFQTPGGISGAVEAAAAPEAVAGDGEDAIAIPIGTAAAISCSAHRERLDGAATLRNVVEGAKEKVTFVAFSLTDVVAVEGSALLLAVAVYQIPSEKGPLVGLLKLGVFVHDAHSILCVHDEPGYRQTFDRIVKGLAASLRGGGEDRRPGARYAELAVMRIGEVPVGFSEEVVREREGGGRAVEGYSSQLLPRGPAELVAFDGYSREEIDAKDLLESGSYVHATNGEVDTNLALSREKDRRTYAYEGQKGGKPLAGKLRTKAGLSTEQWFARRLAGSAPVPAKPLVHEAYSHEASPTSALPVSYAAVPGKPRRVTMKMGPMQVEGDLDASGYIEAGEIPIGPTKLVVRRIFSRGTP